MEYGLDPLTQKEILLTDSSKKFTGKPIKSHTVPIRFRRPAGKVGRPKGKKGGRTAPYIPKGKPRLPGENIFQYIERTRPIAMKGGNILSTGRQFSGPLGYEGLETIPRGVITSPPRNKPESEINEPINEEGAGIGSYNIPGRINKKKGGMMRPPGSGNPDFDYSVFKNKANPINFKWPRNVNALKKGGMCGGTTKSKKGGMSGGATRPHKKYSTEELDLFKAYGIKKRSPIHKR